MTLRPRAAPILLADSDETIAIMNKYDTSQNGRLCARQSRTPQDHSPPLPLSFPYPYPTPPDWRRRASYAADCSALPPPPFHPLLARPPLPP